MLTWLSCRRTALSTASGLCCFVLLLLLLLQCRPPNGVHTCARTLRTLLDLHCALYGLVALAEFFVCGPFGFVGWCNLCRCLLCRCLLCRCVAAQPHPRALCTFALPPLRPPLLVSVLLRAAVCLLLFAYASLCRWLLVFCAHACSVRATHCQRKQTSTRGLFYPTCHIHRLCVRVFSVWSYSHAILSFALVLFSEL